MFDHIGLKVGDLPASLRFYRAVLGALGYASAGGDASYAGFGPPGAPALWLYQDDHRGVAAARGMHVALRAPDRDAVRRFHAAGLEAGGRDNGAPGLRPDYSPDYYAAFLIDPDGNNLEAVCFA